MISSLLEGPRSVPPTSADDQHSQLPPPDLSQPAASTDDLLRLRDEIVREAEARIDAGDTAGAAAVLRRLEAATTDAQTLERTDRWLPKLAAGKRVVATFDPARVPAPDEVVIIYGNYPHMFGNVVVNNPVRRHVADFWMFRHDVVESDARWNDVQQIYIINVEARRDRLDATLRELVAARAPFDRLTVVRATEKAAGDVSQEGGQMACLTSHIRTLRAAQAAGFGRVLVLEDDFCFSSDLDAHLNDLRTFFARRYDYWVCLVATSKYGAVIPKDDLVSFCRQVCTNTGGYLISAEGIAQVLPVFEGALDRIKTTGSLGTYAMNAVDRCWAVLQPSGKFLVFRRKFGFQVSSFSDIERSISRYLD